MNNAVAYYRTSSAASIGFDKDSLDRQRNAVRAYAKSNNIKIVEEYYDAAVSGADPIDQRDGFSRMLSEMHLKDATVVLVENASRFARDLSVQLTGFEKLKELGISLVAIDSPSSFVDDTPTAQMVRNILGAVSEFEKAQIVARLRSGRERKRQLYGRCEGRPTIADRSPEIVAEAKRLRRKNPKTGKRMSYEKVGSALFALGYTTSRGKAFAGTQVKRMVG